ncbi:MAG: VapC toxin family PIN domain ribonuclease [Lautropia sp.]|nr:VapC toxin family PIN domain ribonuclease [Lautropia sp.]
MIVVGSSVWIDHFNGKVTPCTERLDALLGHQPPCLGDLIWVLDRSYGVKRADIAAAIRLLLDTRNVHADKAAVAAGLAMLDADGDFADGIIAHEGSWQGAEVFVSFDRKAVSLLNARGVAARLL